MRERFGPIVRIWAMASCSRMARSASGRVTIPQEALPLRRVHERLLEVLSAEWQTAAEVARAAGFKLRRGQPNSYVRTALTELARWERVQHGPDGYKRRA